MLNFAIINNFRKFNNFLDYINNNFIKISKNFDIKITFNVYILNFIFIRE